MGNRIEEYPVPLIFKKIYKSKLSGELKIEGNGFFKHLFFTNGLLDFASTTLLKERVTQILFKKHKITKENIKQLDEILASTDKKKLVGEILARITSLNDDDIHFALLYQSKLIAVQAFPLKTGEWVFLKKNPKIPNTKSLKIELPNVITEGVNLIKDFSFYKNKFTNCSPITTSIPEEIQKYLTAEELDIYMILTSETEASIGQIISDLKHNPTVMWRKIVIFYLQSILAFSTLNPICKNLNDIQSEINDIYYKIQSDSIDYYQLMGLTSDASKEDIENKYFDLISNYHPDKLAIGHGSEFEERVNRVVSEINAAYKVLSDETRRTNYHQKGKNLREVEEKTEELQEKQQAKQLYQKATALYQENKFRDCIYPIMKAIALDQSKASYYMLLGLCQSKYPSQRRKAVTNFTKAGELEPWNADPIFAIGNVFRSENLLKKAKYYFEKALQLNMDHTLANRSLQEIKAGKISTVLSPFLKKKS